MKNLEFRIYDKHNKKMLYSSDTPKQGVRQYIPFEFDIGRGWNKDWLSEKMIKVGTDKNGNDVYEGDIIKDGGGDEWVVFWKQESLGFFKKPLRNPADHYSGLQGLSQWWQLVGNIYERQSNEQ